MGDDGQNGAMDAPQPAPEKVCIDCGGSFPRTVEFFRPGRDAEFDPRCHGCRRKKNAAAKKAKAARKMGRIEQRSVDAFLGAATTGGENIPHSSELLERIMEYMGGSSGFAAVVVKHFFDAAPGGSHRTKMIEAVLRLVTKNTELGGSKKPLTQWSEQELEDELDARIRAMAMNMKRRLVLEAPQTPGDLAAALGSQAGHLPAAAVAGDSDRTGGTPDRGVEAVRAHGAAGGVPPGPGE